MNLERVAYYADGRRIAGVSPWKLSAVGLLEWCIERSGVVLWRTQTLPLTCRIRNWHIEGHAGPIEQLAIVVPASGNRVVFIWRSGSAVIELPRFGAPPYDQIVPCRHLGEPELPAELFVRQT